MKLKGKLISTYIIIALFIVIVAVVALLSLNQVNQNSKEMYHNRVVPLTIIVELANLTENTRVQMLSAVLNETPQLTENAKANMEKITELIQDYRALVLTEAGEQAITQFETDWTAFTTIVESNIQLINNSNYSAALDGLRAGGVAFGTSQESLMVLKDRNISLTEELNNSNYSTFKTSQFILCEHLVRNILKNIF